MTRVRVTRTIPAKPAQVYRAWLDPALLIRWMAPGALAATTAVVDERVGGHYRIHHGGQGGFDAELVELVPDRRLVFRWGFVGPRWRSGPSFDSLLTVTFDETDGGTLLTLVHERLDDLAAAMPEVAANVETGWASALDKLAEVTR